MICLINSGTLARANYNRVVVATWASLRLLVGLLTISDFVPFSKEVPSISRAYGYPACKVIKIEEGGNKSILLLNIAVSTL